MALKDSYFTISEAAKEIGVARQTISRWITEGKLNAEKVGREMLIEKNELYRHEDERYGKLIYNLLVRLLTNYVREEYNYAKEDTVELIKAGRAFIFSVTRRDGTREKVTVDFDGMSWNEDKQRYFVEVKKIKKEAYRGSGRMKKAQRSSEG